jgi:hypothetical protein
MTFTLYFVVEISQTNLILFYIIFPHLDIYEINYSDITDLDFTSKFVTNVTGI